MAERPWELFLFVEWHPKHQPRTRCDPVHSVLDWLQAEGITHANETVPSMVIGACLDAVG